MTATAVFITEQVDPAVLTLDRLPRSSSLLGQPAAEVELVAAIEPLKVGGRPMLRLVTHTPPGPWATPMTRYVSPDSIVAL